MGLLTRKRPSDLTPVARLREDFDHALQRLFDGDDERAEVTRNGDWMPSVDVSEDDKAIQVKVDLPGLKPEEVDISLSDHDLTIKGERKEEKEEKEKEYHRVERRYGSFYRRITLPTSADTEKVEAKSDNGVITVTIPKLPEATSKRINVKPK